MGGYSEGGGWRFIRRAEAGSPFGSFQFLGGEVEVASGDSSSINNQYESHDKGIQDYYIVWQYTI